MKNRKDILKSTIESAINFAVGSFTGEADFHAEIESGIDTIYSENNQATPEAKTKAVVVDATYLINAIGYGLMIASKDKKQTPADWRKDSKLLDKMRRNSANQLNELFKALLVDDKKFSTKQIGKGDKFKGKWYVVFAVPQRAAKKKPTTKSDTSETFDDLDVVELAAQFSRLSSADEQSFFKIIAKSNDDGVANTSVSTNCILRIIMNDTETKAMEQLCKSANISLDDVLLVNE